MSIREIAQNFHNFCPKYILPLFEFSHCFSPKLSIWLLLPKFREKPWQIRAKAMGNSGKSNGKIWAKAMRKLGKRRHIFRAKIIAFSPNFPIAFARIFYCFSRISHCFCPNFPLLLPEFFVFIFFFFFWGAQCPPAPRLCPPPPNPFSYATVRLIMVRTRGEYSGWKQWMWNSPFSDLELGGKCPLFDRWCQFQTIYKFVLYGWLAS